MLLVVVYLLSEVVVQSSGRRTALFYTSNVSRVYTSDVVRRLFLNPLSTSAAESSPVLFVPQRHIQ
jgi:hypothetical protein